MAEDKNPILEGQFGDDEPEEKGPRVFLDDASDKAQINRKGRRKKITEENADAFWKRVFDDPIGRQEMYQILKDSQAFALVSAFTPNGSNAPEAILYKIGQQQFALGLYHKWLFRFPQLVYLMHEENNERFPRAGRKRPKATITHGRPAPDDADQ